MMRYSFNNTITIPSGNIKLEGQLIIPEGASSLVLFSHGSGSSRLSPRNNFVAKELHKKNTGTFLLDLLTTQEDETYANRFNINLLSERLVEATKHLKSLKQSSYLDLGYFGASTGAASALRASTELPNTIHAIVSRGGRPDLAMEVIPQVKAATLLIVGELDNTVVELNTRVYKKLTCTKQMEIVKGATHLFEEPGTLEEVAHLAAGWFCKYLEPVKMQIH